MPRRRVLLLLAVLKTSPAFIMPNEEPNIELYENLGPVVHFPARRSGDPEDPYAMEAAPVQTIPVVDLAAVDSISEVLPVAPEAVKQKKKKKKNTNRIGKKNTENKNKEKIKRNGTMKDEEARLTMLDSGEVKVNVEPEGFFGKRVLKDKNQSVVHRQKKVAADRVKRQLAGKQLGKAHQHSAIL